jgi:hypothetical protein
MRKFKLIVPGVLAILMLAVPASAAAKHKDRNHDGIPDRWEKVHHLSLRVDQARRDQDHDGLKNRAEFRAQMDPRDADSDNDGVPDGQEHAGKVVSFDGTTLTVDVFGSSQLVGKVTPDTEIECDPGDDNGHGGEDTQATGLRHDGGEQGNSQSGDGEHNNRGDDNENGDQGNDQGGDNEGDNSSCPPGALAPGAVVQEARLSLTSAGLVFEKIELLVQ